jgi:SAM-dependent methyltransferase
MKFGEKYTNYWASAVNKSVDGTVIAGINEAKFFLQYLGIEKHHRVLDLGCSFGRMCEVLSIYSDHICGIEPDPFAVEKARLQRYEEVHQGSAEATGFEKNSFDFVFCWAVFDVVEHIKGLTEINRILKSDGKLLLTGKNNNYHSDDALAFRAEKNAYLKDFPNRFTNLDAALKDFKTLGFKLDKLFLFPRRGDFGLMNFSEHGDDVDCEYIGYEYLILCHKVADQDVHVAPNENLDGEFSNTATKIAIQRGYAGAKELFESIGID